MVVYFCILVFQHISWNLIALTLANSSIQWCNHTISVTPASSSSHGKNVIFHCINFIADTCWQNVGKNNLGRWVVAFLFYLLIWVFWLKILLLLMPYARRVMGHWPLFPPENAPKTQTLPVITFLPFPVQMFFYLQPLLRVSQDD